MSGDSSTAAFAKKLIAREFGELFIYPMHYETIETIWADERNRLLLDEVLADPDLPDEARFLAAEVFFRKDILFMQRHSPAMIAAIYANALRNDFTGMANSWGLLYDHQDDGPVGIAFLTIGQKAIPALCGLLDDESTRLQYQGSVEAAVGNGYGYRTKDFAAYYIGRILGKPLRFHRDIAARDQEIERLKRDTGCGFSHSLSSR